MVNVTNNLKPSLLWRLAVSVRPYSFSATLGVGLVVLFMGLSEEKNWNAWSGLAAGLSALFLHSAINLYNDYSDHLRKIDFLGGPGGSGCIQKNWLTEKQVKTLAHLFLVLGIGFAGFLGLTQSWTWELWTLAGVGILGVLLYSGGLFQFGAKYVALGELLVFLMCGPLLGWAFSWALFQEINLSVTLLSSILGLFAVALLFCNNLQDIPHDQSKGALTLPQLLGFGVSKRLLPGIYGLGFLLILGGVAMGFLPPFSLLGLLVAIPVWHFSQEILKASGPFSPELENSRLKAAKMHGLMTLALSLGFLLDWLWR
jgi:1,4-dihydroxy-2-naphthoate octaprenyltransferase